MFGSWGRTLSKGVLADRKSIQFKIEIKKVKTYDPDSGTSLGCERFCVCLGLSVFQPLKCCVNCINAFIIRV